MIRQSQLTAQDKGDYTLIALEAETGSIVLGSDWLKAGGDRPLPIISFSSIELQ